MLDDDSEELWDRVGWVVTIVESWSDANGVVGVEGVGLEFVRMGLLLVILAFDCEV